MLGLNLKPQFIVDWLDRIGGFGDLRAAAQDRFHHYQTLEGRL